MLAFADLAAELFTCEIGGNSYSWPMLKRKQIGALMKKWAGEDRAELLRQCKEAECPPADALEQLRRVDAESKLLSWFVGCLAQPSRAGEVLTESAKSQAAQFELHPKALTELATCVAGWPELVVGAQEDAKKNETLTLQT